MGQGAYLDIVNGTTSIWKKVKSYDYQMNHWSFPETIYPGNVARVRIEFGQGASHNAGDDEGKVTYNVDGKEFLIHASTSGSYGGQIWDTEIKVLFQDNFSDYAKPDDPLNLGWKHNGRMLFIMSGSPECRYWVNRGTAFNLLRDQRKVIGHKKIDEISIPGSHDSGMSECHSPTLGANNSNVVTQYWNIYKQLTHGIRYFDIRPIIGGGHFHTGHYSDTSVGWQGARGQSMQDVVSNINDFISSSYKPYEPIILDLSHGYDTDNGYKDFTQSQWNDLFDFLQTHLSSAIYNGSKNPFDLTLNELVFNDEKSVVIFIIPDNVAPPSNSYAFQHKYVYNKYSDTDDFEDMKSDQIKKMYNEAPYEYFLLSWTLTQTATQAVLGYPSILDLSDRADDAIVYDVMKACHFADHSGKWPNIVYIDGVHKSDVALLTYGINMAIKYRS